LNPDPLLEISLAGLFQSDIHQGYAADCEQGAVKLDGNDAEFDQVTDVGPSHASLNGPPGESAGDDAGSERPRKAVEEAPRDDGGAAGHKGRHHRQVIAGFKDPGDSLDIRLSPGNQLRLF